MRLLALAAFSVVATASHAHFLYLDASATPKHAVASFAETGVDAPLPLLAPRMSELKRHNLSPASADGLRVRYEITKTGAPVGVDWDYGIVTREASPFFLKYFAKSAVTAKEASARVGQLLEITLAQENGQWFATVWQNGKPKPGAELKVVEGEDEGAGPLTDARGKLAVHLDSFPIAIRTRVIEKKKGSVGGKTFEETRSYASLTVGSRFVDAVCPNKDANGEAYRLLREAAEHRARIPFETVVKGKVEITDETGTRTAVFTYSATDGLDTQGASTLNESDVEGVRSLFAHRSGRKFDDGDGQYALAFGERTTEGMEVKLNDSMSSYYVVANGQIRQVNRSMGPCNLRIDIVENRALGDGTYLPRFFVVYSLGEDGAIKSSTAFSDQYTSVAGVWLPLERRTTTNNGKTTQTKILRFSNLEIVQPK